MRTAAFLLLTLLLSSVAATAQDVRYISDKQYIPLRSGAGNDYRIVHRGLPSGTRLTVARTSEDGVWSEITTDGGTSGWLRAQYLMKELPAQRKLEAAEERAASAEAKFAELQAAIETLRGERVELRDQFDSSSSELDSVVQQLAHLKQVSGKALQLDADNRRLVEENENLRAEADMLEAENQRLNDKLRSEDFINGALAVLLGVIVALVVPRLVPRKRKSSSWA
ncbi:MAG: TIGR04211 family SH3 domain-containing protein [Halioglobus sp.]|nr:TIGR04211 family SH3 domain-containing protein [Halioglobus sp.]